MHDAQLSWSAFFENEQKQRDSRRSLIRGLPTHAKVIELLIALDEISYDGRLEKEVIREGGTVLLSVPLRRIEAAAGMSRNTVRKYLDVLGLTPYASVEPSTNAPYLITIFWLQIVDRGQRKREPSGSREPGQRSIPEGVKVPSGGGQSSPRRGSKLEGEGVKLTPVRKFDPPPPGGGSNPPNPGLPGFLRSNSKNPENPGARGPDSIRGFWRRWRLAIAQRSLRVAADVEELYAIAVAEGCFEASEANRFNVYAQAAHDNRCAKAKTALFRENVAYARWFATCEEEDDARYMMASLDRAIEPEQPAEYREPAQQTVESKQAQMLALAQRYGRSGTPG